MAAPERNALFEIYNLSGKYSKSFGELIEDQPEAGIVLDGNIIGDAETQGFIYGGRHLGVLAGYSAGGRVMDVYDKRNGQYTFSFKLPVACQEVIVQEERIYLLGGDGVTVWRFKH
jgi:hypothetical protein